MTELIPYQNNVLSTYDEVEKAAKAMAGSGFFQDTRQASQAIVKIMAGRELGFGPFASMTGINIINGKPAFGANIMAASVKKSGRYNYLVTEMSDKACTIEFLERLDGKWQRSGISSFTLEDAKKAGTKNLEKFARNMLFARAMSNGVRWYCPDVMNGSTIYTPEELGADVDEEGNVIEAQQVEWKPVQDPRRIAAGGWFEPQPEPEEEAPAKPEEKKPFTLEDACKVMSDTEGVSYRDLTVSQLAARWNSLTAKLKDTGLSAEERAAAELKQKAAKRLLDAKKNGEI